MKTILVCAASLLLPLLIQAQTTLAPAPDLTTLAGKTYKQARVFRVEPDGINYMFAGGMVKIPFTDLPESVRKQYSYDPKQAAAYQVEDERAQAQLQARMAADGEAENRRVAAAKAQQRADEQRKQAAEKLRGSGSKVITTINQVIRPGSVLCHGLLYLGKFQTYSDATICLVGAPADLVDGQEPTTDIYPCGSYRHTTVLGAGATVKMHATTPELAATMLAKTQGSQ